jgi:hypothetical protein
MPGKERPQMFLERAFRESCNFTNVEHSAHNGRPAPDFRSRILKYIAHFVGEPVPVFRRVEPQ